MMHARFLLLPIVAALTFIAVPAGAVSIGSGTPTSAAQSVPAQSQALTKKQMKQQRKLQKKCAKLAAGKIKKAKKRAKYERLCAKPSSPSQPAQGGSGAGPDLGDDTGASPDTPNGTGGAGPATGSAAPGGASGHPGQGSGSDPGNPGGGYVEEILDLPPIFTPPAGEGGGESQGGAAPQLETLPARDVPEPGSLALLGLGLLGLGLARRPRR